MKTKGNDLYLVRFKDGEIHLVAEKEEVEELLAEKMEDPRGYYAEILEKESPEKAGEPKIIKLELPSNFSDDPLTWDGEITVEHAWTYQYIPYWVLFGEGKNDKKRQNRG